MRGRKEEGGGATILLLSVWKEGVGRVIFRGGLGACPCSKFFVIFFKVTEKNSRLLKILFQDFLGWNAISVFPMKMIRDNNKYTESFDIIVRSVFQAWKNDIICVFSFFICFIAFGLKWTGNELTIEMRFVSVAGCWPGLIFAHRSLEIIFALNSRLPSCCNPWICNLRNTF